MDKPVIIDYQTKYCGNIMQPLFDMVWEGLGWDGEGSPVPQDIRTHIEAQPVAPDPVGDETFVGSAGGWVQLSSTADFTGLTAYVDSENAAQDAAFTASQDAQDAAFAAALDAQAADLLGLIVALG